VAEFGSPLGLSLVTNRGAARSSWRLGCQYCVKQIVQVLWMFQSFRVVFVEGISSQLWDAFTMCSRLIDA
jgi:hypothetical protein